MANGMIRSSRLLCWIGTRRSPLLGTEAAKRDALERNAQSALDALTHGVDGAAEVLAWAQDALYRMDQEAGTRQKVG